LGGIRRKGRQKVIERKTEKRKKIVTENSQRVPGCGTFLPSANAIRGMQRGRSDKDDLHKAAFVQPSSVLP
jgi:hypothetical protein